MHSLDAPSFRKRVALLPDNVRIQIMGDLSYFHYMKKVGQEISDRNVADGERYGYITGTIQLSKASPAFVIASIPFSGTILP